MMPIDKQTIDATLAKIIQKHFPKFIARSFIKPDSSGYGHAFCLNAGAGLVFIAFYWEANDTGMHFFFGKFPAETALADIQTELEWCRNATQTP